MVLLHHSGRALGYFNINLPEKVLTSEETEVEDQFSIQSTGYFLSGKYFLVIQNELAKRQAAALLSKSTPKSKNKGKAVSKTNKTSSRVQNKSNTTTAKKVSNWNLSSEMNKVLDKHQGVSNNENLDMQSCLYLSKLNNDVGLEDLERTMLDKPKDNKLFVVTQR